MISAEHKEESARFYRQITKLVLPIVVQNLLSAAVSSADVVMLNYVGQSSISAVSLAAQYSSILFMIYYGLGTGATILCAQYYGKGDLRAIRAVEGIGLRFSLALSGMFAAAVLLCPEMMMRVFTADPELVRIGASYLRIMSVCYLCWGVTEVYLAVLRSIGQVLISTVLNAIAFSLNIILNAVFIFGLFGAPKLGAVGGAIIVSARSKEVKLDLRYLFIRNRALLSDFVKISLPALGNDAAWGVAFSLYSAILGHMGSDAVAAYSFVNVARNFGTVLCFGFASAGGILLGNVIGENKMEQARRDASRLMKLTVISGALGGFLILCATPLVLKYADLSEQALRYLKVMLLINTYYVMGAAVNTTLIAGVFRAGGDSRFGLICDTITMWCYAVPLGFVAAFVLKLPVLAVYFLLCTDEFVKWPVVIRHYRSGKWLKNITRDDLFETAGG